MNRILCSILLAAFLHTQVSAYSAEKQLYRLSNAFVSLEFYTPQQGGGLRSVKNQRGFEFINRHNDKSLWQVELKRILQTEPAKSSILRWHLDTERLDGVAERTDTSKKDDIIRISSDGTSALCKVEKGKDSLTMSWQRIDVGAEKAVLDVSVTVTLAENDRFARFRVSFNNRSNKFTVFYLTAPLFNGIYPSDGKTELDWLASPVFNGRLMRDPIKNGIMGKPYRFQPNRSGHSMQFDTYYHNKNGLYFGCFDGMQNTKRYYLAADNRKGFSWGMVHVPNNMKSVPQIWSTPYDTVLRCYEGDWYDACRIYREWALKQSWTAEGPLYQRVSTPEWFKEIDLWMMWSPIQGPKMLPYDRKVLESLYGLSKGFKVHYWGKGHHLCRMNPECFPLDDKSLVFIDKAKAHDYKLIGYVQGIIWDRETKSFQELNGSEHTVRNFYGQQVVWEFDKKKGSAEHHIGVIVHPGGIWTEVLGDTIFKMARVGFDAAYLDSFNHGGTYMNFNPRYSNECGGGNTYIKNNQEMLRKIKKQVRQINPNFCFSSESFWEGNMAIVDGFLTCNTTGQLLKKGVIYAIPMIHSVYHDYALCLGAWMSRWDLEADDGLSYIAKNAQAFVWGVKSAWNQPFYLSKHKDHQVALEITRKRCKAYAAAHKFLVYGEMLREPKLLTPVPDVDLKWYINWSKRYYDISMPAVLCSAWRAPDGNLGLVLCNISSERQEISLVFDEADYDIKSTAKARITCLYPSMGKTSKWESLNGLNIKLSCTVEPRTPMVFEVELKD